MAISALFNTEIVTVDATKSISFTSNQAGYEPLEWSYSGSGNVYTVIGGSDLGCEHGASALMWDLGFKHYAPHPNFQKKPASINMGLTAAKQSFWMPNNRIWLSYGHSWTDIHASASATIVANYAKWQTMNACFYDPFPAGHRWNGIITSSTLTSFWAANPQLLRLGPPNGIYTFSLDTLTPGSADYNNLVEICAAFILSAASNTWLPPNRTHFDPVDGDDNVSDDVYPFTKAVAARVRSGTDPIGPYGTLSGRPDAQLGIYAYAGHRLPPADYFGPGVYVQVTDGFLGGLSFDDLVAAYQPLCDFVGVRGYLDTMIWSYSQPFVLGTFKEGYMDVIDNYYNIGLRGINSEFQSNWLVNMVGTRAVLRKLRTGTGTYTDALTEIVADIFDSDPKVTELYQLWSQTYESFHQWNLQKSFAIVDAMQDSWYKTLFKKHLVINYEFANLPPKPTSGWVNGDAYYVALERLMRHITGVLSDDITHCWAWVRRQTNANVQTPYPPLYYNQTPKPDWWQNPAAPTDQEFADYFAILSADTARDEDLDDLDLVVLHNTPSIINPVTWPDATSFSTEGSAEYLFIGPGTFTYTGEQTIQDPDTGEPITIDADPVNLPLGPGLHRINLFGNYIVTNTGGEVFLNYFPRTRRQSPGVGTGNNWSYHPSRLDGEFGAYADSNMRIIDQSNTITNITPSTDPSVFNDILPGVFMIENGNTSNYAGIYNSGRYLGMKQTKQLIPRVFVEEDFPNISFVTKP